MRNQSTGCAGEGRERGEEAGKHQECLDSWTSHMETWVKGGRNWEKSYHLVNPSLSHRSVLMSSKGQGLWFTELALESWWLALS